MPFDPSDLAAVGDLSAAADRLDELAESADLMDDVSGANRLREQAQAMRMAAMRRLDD